VTLSYVFGNRKGAILNLDTGAFVLRDINYPQDGLIVDNCLFVCDPIAAAVSRFEFKEGTISPAPLQRYQLKITNTAWKRSTQYARGLIIQGDKLVCGSMHFKKPHPGQVPPRLVVFDKTSGMQLKEIFLPQIEGLREPCIYSLCAVPQPWLDYLPPHQDPRYYCGQNAFDLSSEEVDPLSEPIEKEDPQQLEKEGEQEEPQKLEIGGAIEEIEVTTEKGSNFEEGKTIDKRLSMEFDDVSFCFYRRKSSLLRGSERDRRFWAIKNISFQIYDGDMVGIVGRNGSGKSTTALLIAGVYEPDKGTVKVKGKVGLLALGTGFNAELTGLENIYINGAYLGHSRKYTKNKIDEIVDFSELGEFIGEPIKTYSTGMRSRLAFSIAAVMQPDILVIDEVMATGDQCFKAKAQERIKEMVESAKSVIIISHQVGLLKKLCNRVIWLDGGCIIMDGDPKEVLNSYSSYCKAPEQWLLEGHAETKQAR
jgi:ABC-type polysaccharide/polyol phosphate transport system ATPase subunit